MHLPSRVQCLAFGMSHNAALLLLLACQRSALCTSPYDSIQHTEGPGYFLLQPQSGTASSRSTLHVIANLESDTPIAYSEVLPGPAHRCSRHHYRGTSAMICNWDMYPASILHILHCWSHTASLQEKALQCCHIPILIKLVPLATKHLPTVACMLP